MLEYIKERIMYFLFGYTSNDVCDWYDVANDEYCDRKDGHKGQHLSDDTPWFHVDEIWTVLN